MYSLGGHRHGLGPRYCCLSTTCAHASGCLGFFTHTGNFESPHRFLKWWIAFRLPFVVNAFSHVSSAFSLRRLQNRAVFHFSHPPPTAVPHGDFWDNCETLGRVGQVAGMFSHFLICFFFLLTSSFAAQSPRSPLLADGHGPPFPRGPTSPHY